MSDEPRGPPEPGAPERRPRGAPPSEEELRRRIEEGLREVRVQDVLLESVVTFINLTARRIGKADERDLEQARVGIEAVRSLVELLEPEPQAQVRNALSELQMLYARARGGDRGGGARGSGGDPPRRSDARPGPDATRLRAAGGLWAAWAPPEAP